MAIYTFNVLSSYPLATHTVTISKTKVTIVVSATQDVVYDEKFDNNSHVDFRCVDNTFQIGELDAQQVFTKTILLTGRYASLGIIEVSNANKFFGTSNEGDSSITHTYNLNQCPVSLSRPGDSAIVKCPCEGTPCVNACYTYGS